MRLIPHRKRSGMTQDPGTSSPVGRLREEMDRLFSRFFGEPWGEVWSPARGAGAWFPEIDVLEGDKEISIRAELPGLNPEDIQVSILGSQLFISGEKKEEKEETRGNVYQSERRYGTFRRTVDLPPGVNPNQLTAEYDKGVLTIRVVKEEKAKPKRITVSSPKESGEGEAEKRQAS